MSQKLDSFVDKQMTINYPTQENKSETSYFCDKFQADSKIETNVFSSSKMRRSYDSLKINFSVETQNKKGILISNTPIINYLKKRSSLGMNGLCKQ